MRNRRLIHLLTFVGCTLMSAQGSPAWAQVQACEAVEIFTKCNLDGVLGPRTSLDTESRKERLRTWAAARCSDRSSCFDFADGEYLKYVFSERDRYLPPERRSEDLEKVEKAKRRASLTKAEKNFVAMGVLGGALVDDVIRSAVLAYKLGRPLSAMARLDALADCVDPGPAEERVEKYSSMLRAAAAMGRVSVEVDSPRPALVSIGTPLEVCAFENALGSGQPGREVPFGKTITVTGGGPKLDEAGIRFKLEESETFSEKVILTLPEPSGWSPPAWLGVSAGGVVVAGLGVASIVHSGNLASTASEVNFTPSNECDVRAERCQRLKSASDSFATVGWISAGVGALVGGYGLVRWWLYPRGQAVLESRLSLGIAPDGTFMVSGPVDF